MKKTYFKPHLLEWVKSLFHRFHLKFGVFLFLLMGVGCAAQKIVYVPTDAKTVIEYKDTTIYIKDSIYFQLPQESVNAENVNKSSHLETSVAESDAWIDEDGELNHTLENKKTQLKVRVDTVVKIQYIDRYQEIPIIQEVEVIKEHIPKVFWYLLGWFIITILYIVLKITKRF